MRLDILPHCSSQSPMRCFILALCISIFVAAFLLSNSPSVPFCLATHGQLVNITVVCENLHLILFKYQCVINYVSSYFSLSPNRKYKRMSNTMSIMYVTHLSFLGLKCMWKWYVDFELPSLLSNTMVKICHSFWLASSIFLARICNVCYSC